MFALIAGTYESFLKNPVCLISASWCGPMIYETVPFSKNQSTKHHSCFTNLCRWRWTQVLRIPPNKRWTENHLKLKKLFLVSKVSMIFPPKKMRRSKKDGNLQQVGEVFLKPLWGLGWRVSNIFCRRKKLYEVPLFDLLNVTINPQKNSNKHRISILWGREAIKESHDTG